MCEQSSRDKFSLSEEDSSESHKADYIFTYVDKYIEEVDLGNVVQLVTGNASNNIVAADLMMEKRRNLFQTSCATHILT